MKMKMIKKMKIKSLSRIVQIQHYMGPEDDRGYESLITSSTVFNSDAL